MGSYTMPIFMPISCLHSLIRLPTHRVMGKGDWIGLDWIGVH